MIDSVEMIRFFTEFILSQKSRPFTSFRVTRRRVQNDHPWPWKGKHSISPTTTQPPEGEEEGGSLLGFGQHVLEKCFIQQSAFGDPLAIFDEVDGIDAGHLLRVKGTESQECLSHHIRR